MGGLHTLEGRDIVRRIRSREVSRREVLEAHLDRLEAVNGAVNAIVDLPDREQALAEADNADRDHERRAGLPLDGVPVSIKDHFDVRGCATPREFERGQSAARPATRRSSSGSSTPGRR